MTDNTIKFLDYKNKNEDGMDILVYEPETPEDVILEKALITMLNNNQGIVVQYDDDLYCIVHQEIEEQSAVTIFPATNVLIMDDDDPSALIEGNFVQIMDS